MKIGMEFRDANISNIDFTNIENGNPGCGGTQFEFALLAHHLLKLDCEYEIYFFHLSDNVFDHRIKDIKVDSMDEIPFAAKSEGIDLFLFWSTHDNSWYQNLQKLGLKSIAWSHNFLSYPEIQCLEQCDMVKKVVSVSREQYELLVGERIFDKCTYIHNMYDFNIDDINETDAEKSDIVCCVGTLIKAKGFHILAKEWPKIVRKRPDAQLFVMGTGTLWNSNIAVGSYGLAEASYEKKFMKYLTGKDGNILPSVHFMGNVGSEKKDFFQKCKVGVVNPTGVETFCISAIEMQASGVPVCSKKANGLIDTVINKKTGFLSYSSRGLRRNILKLLKNNKLNHIMSVEATGHAEKFHGDNIVTEWHRLFQNVFYDEECFNKEYSCLTFRRLKIFRLWIGKLRRLRILTNLPSPYKMNYYIWQLKRKIVKLRNYLLKK